MQRCIKFYKRLWIHKIRVQWIEEDKLIQELVVGIVAIQMDTSDVELHAYVDVGMLQDVTSSIWIGAKLTTNEYIACWTRYKSKIRACENSSVHTKKGQHLSILFPLKIDIVNYTIAKLWSHLYVLSSVRHYTKPMYHCQHLSVQACNLCKVFQANYNCNENIIITSNSISWAYSSSIGITTKEIPKLRWDCSRVLYGLFGCNRSWVSLNDIW